MIIVHRDRFAKEVVALFGAIASECRIGGHFLDTLVQGRDTAFGQRPCDITDAQFYDVGVRVGFLEPGYAFCDVRKEIRSLKFQVVVVYPYHSLLLFACLSQRW